MSARAIQLEADILQAHEQADQSALTGLYEKAAKLKADSGETDAAAFLYTQAYVFALESGHDRAQAIGRILADMGREKVDTRTDR